MRCAVCARICGDHHEHGNRNLGCSPVDGLDALAYRVSFIASRNGHDYLSVSDTDLTVDSRSQNRNWRQLLMKLAALDFLASSCT